MAAARMIAERDGHGPPGGPDTRKKARAEARASLMECFGGGQPALLSAGLAFL
jgi:hypothetical protein